MSVQICEHDGDEFVVATPCRCGSSRLMLCKRSHPDPAQTQHFIVCDACDAVGDAESTEEAAVASWDAAVADPERMLAVDMSAGVPWWSFMPATTPTQRRYIATQAQLYRRYLAQQQHDGGVA